MKSTLWVLSLFITLLSYSQDRAPYGSWYINTIKPASGGSISVGSLQPRLELQMSVLSAQNQQDIILVGSGPCNTFEAEYYYDSSTGYYHFTRFEATTLPCENATYSNFETEYFTILSTSGALEYLFGWGTPHGEFLNLYWPNGSEAYYTQYPIFLGQEELRPNEEITIFPNPTTGQVYVTPNNGAYTLSIYNTAGQLVGTSTHAATLDLSQWAAGLYYVEIRQDRKIYHTKLVKQ